MVNANEINFDIDYNECNTFEYIGDAKNEPHYDLDKRNNEIVGNDVLLTVLTHGLGGDASHWSKASDEAQTDSDSKDLFGYEKDSLVDKLCDALEYKANVLYCSINENRLISTIKTAEFGCKGGDNYHTIMVFETKQTFDSNEYVYSQFDYAVSKAVYDIKLKYGKLPKINLIGHSRGGLINLLYAMDHPFMVNQIFSMGTPYVGSSTAELDIKYNLGIGIGETDKGGDEGERDIIDSTLYNSYMNRWNNMPKDIFIIRLIS